MFNKLGFWQDLMCVIFEVTHVWHHARSRPTGAQLRAFHRPQREKERERGRCHSPQSPQAEEEESLFSLLAQPPPHPTHTHTHTHTHLSPLPTPPCCKKKWVAHKGDRNKAVSVLHQSVPEMQSLPKLLLRQHQITGVVFMTAVVTREYNELTQLSLLFTEQRWVAAL